MNDTYQPDMISDAGGYSKRDLLLHEEVMLIALKDRDGTIHNQAGSFRYALVGAILAELALGKRVVIKDDRREPLRLVDKTPFGDQAIDASLDAIVGSKHKFIVENWINTLVLIPGLKEKTAIGLCRRGILKEEEKKILFIFKRKAYPEINHDPEDLLLARLEDGIFNHRALLDTRTSMLITILNVTGLLAIPFGKKRLKPEQKRIERIASGSLLGGSRLADASARILQSAIQTGVNASLIAAVTASVNTTMTTIINTTS